MILNMIGARIRSLLLLLLGLVNRALCCFSRKRRNSFSDCEVVLQSVSVGGPAEPSQSAGGTGSGRKRDDERDWNSWDDSPRTVDEHIEQYRQQLVQPPDAGKPEQSIDFFQDMTPTIIKPTKVLLRTGNAAAEPPAFSRLEASTRNMMAAAGADLADWSDNDTEFDGGDGQRRHAQGANDGGAGWDELDDENTTHLIREKRREQRAQRQLLQQQQKQHAQQQQQQRAGGPIASRVGGPK